MEAQNVKQLQNGELSHIAFIMDGNGRWAKRHGKPREFGHVAGAKVFRRIVRYCGDIGIRCVTCYTFSTENWKRPRAEVDAIMRLFGKYVLDALSEVHENRIQLHFLGDRSVFPEKLQKQMAQVEAESTQYQNILNIAVNYGARQEILHAVNQLITAGASRITEQDMDAVLYTAHCPPPDLIVRTGAEMRLFNFLLWQAAYAELYFSDVLWPDYSEQDVDAAVSEFHRRKRRFGGV